MASYSFIVDEPLAVLLLSTFVACGPSEPTLQPVATEDESAFQTAVAGTVMAVPTEPPTPTATPVITAEVIANANCRSGPGIIFENLTQVKGGDTALVAGKNMVDSLWYMLELPDGRQCWVMGGTIVISGNAGAVAAIAYPATPVPAATVTVAEPVTITVWHNWGGAYLTAIQNAFADYTKEHPLVTFELFRPGSMQSSLAASIPAKRGPDIIAGVNDQIGIFATYGYVAPLDSLGLGIDMTYLNNTYVPAAVGGVVWRNQIWGLPESQEGIALIYNKAMASEADFPSDPYDFDDLLAKARAYHLETGAALFCNQGFTGNDAYHAAPLFFGFGVPGFIDEEGNAHLDTPEMVAAGEWLVAIKPVLMDKVSHELCRAAIIDGKAAAWWTGPWAIADLENAGVDYGFVTMGRPFVGIKALMLSKNAVDRGHTALVLDVMKYFTGFQVQKAITLANKTVPVNTDVLGDPKVREIESISGFGEALYNGIPMTNAPFTSTQWRPVSEVVKAIWNGWNTPAEACAAAQRTLEQAIKAWK